MSKRQKAPATYEKKLAQLQELREAAGRTKREAERKQHDRGRLSARERVEKLLDPGSFQELDTFTRHRTHDFEMQKKRPWGDAVVTGHGTVDGRRVCVFSQDFSVFGGSLGEVMSEKMCKVMDLAAKIGCPIVGINDSGGARIQEGVVSLGGYGEVFMRNVNCSGVIPQISLVMGPCAGGAVYSPAITDFVFMVKGISHMFITGPEVIRTVTGEQVEFEELGGAKTHSSRSGVAHFACEDEEACLQDARYLLSFLPSNNLEPTPRVLPTDDPLRMEPELDEVVPANPNKPYDVRLVVRMIVDDGEFYEVHEDFAPNIVCGFARLDGHAVGIVANQPASGAGVLDIDASVKAARFVRTCDAFNIPLVVFCDVPGFLPGVAQEWDGIIRHGAKLHVRVRRGDRAEDHDHHAQGLRRRLRRDGLQAHRRRPQPRLADRRGRGHGTRGRREHHLPARHRGLADAGGAPRAPDGRLPRPLRQPVLGRRARLRRRRDHPPRDAAQAHRRARGPADQARRAPQAQARQHPAVTSAAGRRWRWCSLAGAVLRFATLDAQSLWYDEAVTAQLLQMDLGAMLRAIPDSESTPPLYYVLAWLWTQVCGTGEVGLRSLSALLGHRDDRRRVGARPAAGRRPRRASPPRRSSRSTRCSSGSARRRAPTRCWRCSARCRRCCGCARWRSRVAPGDGMLAWGAVAALALATHYYAIFLVGPQALWLALRAPGLRERAAALALPLAAGAALAPLALGQRANDGAAFIGDSALLTRLAQVPKQFLVGYDAPLEPLLVALTALAVLRRRRRARRGLRDAPRRPFPRVRVTRSRLLAGARRGRPRAARARRARPARITSSRATSSRALPLVCVLVGAGLAAAARARARGPRRRRSPSPAWRARSSSSASRAIPSCSATTGARPSARWGRSPSRG